MRGRSELLRRRLLQVRGRFLDGLDEGDVVEAVATAPVLRDVGDARGGDELDVELLVQLLDLLLVLRLLLRIGRAGPLQPDQGLDLVVLRVLPVRDRENARTHRDDFVVGLLLAEDLRDALDCFLGHDLNLCT